MNHFHPLLTTLIFLPLLAPAQRFDAKTVVPKSLSSYRFGMSLDEFTRKNKMAKTAEGVMSFRVEYNEKNTSPDIKQVTYYFDADNNKPLYEMIIQFTDVARLNDHCAKKLGSANDGKQWKWTAKDGYIVKAWRFNNTLVIAAGLRDTEWEKGWDN